MTRMVDVAAVDDLADGEMRAVAAGDDEFLVVRVGDEFYATQAYCPHMGGQLAKGRLDGTVVTCPRHGSRFDLRDGQVLRWTEWSGLKQSLAKTLRHPRPLRTFPVQIQEGRLLVELDTET